MNKPLLIVLEGLDGCGKSSQLDLVAKELSKNHKVKKISFPDYDKPSSTLVKMYLDGELSDNPDGVNAYAASTFYAADRYASFKQYWEEDYNNNTIIIAGRYSTSNAIYQASKVEQNKRDEYLDWLDDYEYNRLALPRPDCVIFLNMPLEVSQKLLLKRYEGDEGKKDLHEAHLEYMNRCRECAMYSAEKFGWTVVNCANADNTAPLSKEDITAKLIDIINEVIINNA